jgi:hypothetical protein
MESYPSLLVGSSLRYVGIAFYLRKGGNKMIDMDLINKSLKKEVMTFARTMQPLLVSSNKDISVYRYYPFTSSEMDYKFDKADGILTCARRGSEKPAFGHVFGKEGAVARWRIDGLHGCKVVGVGLGMGHLSITCRRNDGDITFEFNDDGAAFYAMLSFFISREMYSVNDLEFRLPFIDRVCDLITGGM